MQTNYENIPRALKDRPNWVVYRLTPDPASGKMKKLPFNPVTGKCARCNDPRSWTDFETAVKAAEKYGFDGLGFEFSREAGLVGIDIDHCYDPEAKKFSGIARDILARAGGYGEFSPSGTGIHLWFLGSKPEGPFKNTATGVEMYDSSRFFTVTGNPIPGSQAEIGPAPEGFLPWVQEVYLPARRKAAVTPVSGQRMSDNQLLKTAAESRGGEDFMNLFRGRWQEKYPSQSEADSALCCRLAYWTGKDPERMDRLFRRSGLMREKWDARHYADGRTYGQGCLENAIANTEKVYDPGKAGDRMEEGTITEEAGCLYFRGSNALTRLTNFVFRPVELVKGEEDTVLTADLVTAGKGETYRMDLSTGDLSNLNRFKDFLTKKTLALSYYGTDRQLVCLKDYLNGLEWKVKTGVKELGIHDHEGRRTFVKEKTAFAAGGAAVDSLVQLPCYSSLTTELPEYEALDGDGLRELGPHLLGYNSLPKTVSILGWAGCCFLKSTLMGLNKKIPLLFCIGEAGSGKSTTLERVILPLFGTDRVLAATQVTPFTLMKNGGSSNLVPLALDEFKPSRMSRGRLQTLSNHFRDSYDGHSGQRGRADLSMVSYTLSAPVVVAGEEASEETAVRERSVELLFSKKDLKDPEHRQSFQAVAGRGDSLRAFGRLLLEAALTVTAGQVLDWYTRGRGRFEGD